ncbi:NAD-dependent epimerase/dehydratase family protein [Rhodospirillum centenum]|uniref:NAD-dependent epimerase/dehydratase family protein n=1 Tax=Rhodospirillum centenum TaxID=34018 RepID=UPI0011D06563|nr:NAD(P)-dependent oxidoreductase [Rhodospirillum centenum]
MPATPPPSSLRPPSAVTPPSIDVSALRGRRVLVIGASGFLGAHLVTRLGRLGAQVWGMSRSPWRPGLPAEPAGWWPCDASVPERLAEAFAHIRPEIVYHLTSDSRGGREVDLIGESIRNDVIATVNVLVEATRRGVDRLVLAASLEEPTGEAGEAVPSSPYAAAKWTTAGYARMMAALHGLPVTVLRLMMTYGPGQKEYKVIPASLLALLRGEPARLGSGLRPVDWVFVDDVTDAFLRAGLAPYTGADSIDIGTGRLVTLRDCLTLAGEMLGRSDLLHFGALPDRPLEMIRAADTGPALERLGWRPTTTLAEGLTRTIGHYREHLERESPAEKHPPLARAG